MGINIAEISSSLMDTASAVKRKVQGYVNSLFFSYEDSEQNTPLKYDSASKCYKQTVYGKTYTAKAHNGGDVIDINADGSYVEAVTLKNNVQKIYTVSPQGKNKSVATYKNGIICSEEFFNEKGNVTSKNEYDGDGIRSKKYTFNYNKKGEYLGGKRVEYCFYGQEVYRTYYLNSNNRETGGYLPDGTSWKNRYSKNGSYVSTFKTPTGETYRERYTKKGEFIE